MALDRAQEIKKRIALSSVVKGVVSLKGEGYKFLGLCPFHQEKTPSFNVRDDTGRFKCFGCGASGDIFQFIMLLRGLSFKEAVDELGEKAGIFSNYKNNESAKDNQTIQRKKLERANAVAHRFFMEQLHSEKVGRAAISYLVKERKLSHAMLGQAKIGFGGFSKDDFVSYLRNNQVKEEEAILAGLLKQGQYALSAPFIGRIIFPIRQADGKVIAFGGRSFLEADKDLPKYVNTQATELYEKRKSFYGLYESHQAILKGQVPFLVEGYFDAMALWAIGRPALALCGTAFTTLHAALLKRLSARLILCFDNDEAGFKALSSALLPIFSNKLSPSVVLLEHKDPGDYLASGQLAALKEKLNDERDALCYVIDKLSVLGGRDIGLRLSHIDELLPIFSAISRPLMQRQYVGYLASKLHEDPSLLWMEIKKKQKPNVKEETNAAVKIELSQQERLLANVLVTFPELFLKLKEVIKEQLHPDFIDFFENPADQAKHKLASVIAELKSSNAKHSLGEAEAIIDALHQKALKAKARNILVEKRKKLQQAEQQGDFKSVLSSLREHSEELQRDKKPLKKTIKNDSSKLPQKDHEFRHLAKATDEQSDEEGWW